MMATDVGDGLAVAGGDVECDDVDGGDGDVEGDDVERSPLSAFEVTLDWWSTMHIWWRIL